MSVIDIESLLESVSAESPCGPDLEYDPLFEVIENAAEGKPARFMGKEEVEAAVPPDWEPVKNTALGMFARTKDLRVTLHLIRALIHFNGFVGLQSGLKLLSGLLQTYWTCLHPQLDPDDESDPVRINCLRILCDPHTMLQDLRDLPLIRSPALGQFSLHYVHAAQGKLSTPKGQGETPKIATFDAAFKDRSADVQKTSRILEAVILCQQELETIRALFSEKVGSINAPDFKPLAQLLDEIRNILTLRLPQPSTGKEDVIQTEIIEGEEATPLATSTQVSRSTASMSGQVNTREDAILMLNEICDYFEQQEPSSPVPLLLRRATRLIAMDFMEILRDMAPNGVQQVELIRGPEQKE